MSRPLVLVLALASFARADAVVVTRAMTASTIAEVFVEEDLVRVELEIGVSDLDAFVDLLPNEIREKMGLEPEPLEERLPRFFTEVWVLRADEGEPLPGFVTAMAGRPRLIRDEITGDPLPNQPEDAEVVIYAELAFPLGERPKRLSVKPPTRPDADATATIGLCLYHQGVAVNDFRYLSREEPLSLDWEDPWYSQFENKNFWRQFKAPIQAFLYVEPFEVRKEVVVRPVDLERWIDLGLEGKETIAAEEWGALKQEVADFLIGRCPVVIDGKTIAPVLDRIHFIERTLRTSQVIERPRDLRTVSAMLGVIFSYPTTGLPQEVTMDWELFAPRIQRIPSSAADEAGGLPSYLTPDDHVLRWQNFLLNPTRAKLVELDSPPASGGLTLPLASLLCLVGAAVAVVTIRKKQVGRIAGAAFFIAAIALWPFAHVQAANPFAGAATLTEEEVGSVCGDLLRNVYRAFDFREESDIYDVLARSTSGELLTDVYLETRRALELENQGGARARVQDVDVVATSSMPVGDGPGFKSRTTWNVAGSVGHWGHMHQRRNQYQAELTIEPVDGSWRITGLELLSEERL